MNHMKPRASYDLYSRDRLVDLGTDTDDTVQLDPAVPANRNESFSEVNAITRPCIVFVNGHESGRVVVLDAPTVEIGRSSRCGVVVSEPTVSRRHLLMEVTPDGVQVVDLRSRNGVFVNGKKITRDWLARNDQVRIGPEVVLRFSYFTDAEISYLTHMYKAATFDSLTLTFNRQYFNTYLERYGEGALPVNDLALLLVDIDRFKSINDRFGHELGDQALCHVASIIRSTVRPEDIVCRYGGEEFAILVNKKPGVEAEHIAERVRHNISVSEMRQSGRRIHLTVSIGVALMTEADGCPNNLFNLADKRMYSAKSLGRNRVVCHNRAQDNTE
ncbi:GGDEF domain-containing protein [Roseibium sp. RKSG952]|uniref:GGDEF domain-containing protein n=1 Tax=Roseibium sp. RKSG952 TaxID=2529384 RepID=UPI0012BD0838|nr:GGDEF domain-containing protein [Roseibium sp. RKSG952]MTH97503.1 diguanylate cyclase [Roseibium sp. RKSG952]